MKEWVLYTPVPVTTVRQKTMALASSPQQAS